MSILSHELRKKKHAGKPFNPQLPSNDQISKLQAEYAALVKREFEQLAREQAKLQELAVDLVRQLSREEPELLAQKLHDENPLVRWVAIEAAAKKWMPLERQLIELLNDTYPDIRMAARQALVRLSRGNDFGPTTTAKRAQIEEAQDQWRQWLARQFTRRPQDSYTP